MTVDIPTAAAVALLLSVVGCAPSAGSGGGGEPTGARPASQTEATEGPTGVEGELGEPVEAQWIVSPDVDLGPEATRVPLLVREVSCASGRSAEGRIGHVVAYADDEVAITVFVARLPGVRRCPGNPLTPYTVELDEPVGDRELVNGASSEIAQRPIVPPGTPTVHREEGLLVGWPNGLDEELNEVVLAFHRLAQRDDWPLETLDIPVAVGDIELLLGSGVERRSLDPEELRRRDAWVFDRTHEPYAERSTLSVLEILRGTDFLVVGDYIPCPGDQPPVPEGLEELERIRVAGESVGSCRDHWWVDIYVDGEHEVHAIQLHYWEP